MTMGSIVKTSFFAGFIIIIAGAFAKLLHYKSAELFLVAGLIFSLIFIITAIYEVRTSRYINSSEKTAWTVGFLFMSSIVGWVYLLSGRKRVVRK